MSLLPRTYIKERESYSMDIIDYRAFCTESQFLLCFSNTSTCPLTIIDIRYDGLICLLEPKAIETKLDGTIVRASAQFPLCIPAHGAQYTYYVYDRYSRQFNKMRDTLGLDPRHRPHDGRVQFVTMAKKAGLDEYVIKKIVGHYIDDVTEKSYTKRDIEWIRSEIEKIK